jgi:hypothetical protein
VAKQVFIAEHFGCLELKSKLTIFKKLNPNIKSIENTQKKILE